MIPNRPTETGRRIGARIADACDIVAERQRAMFPNLRERCGTCAFRAGTIPNGCEETLADAVKCLVEKDRLFMCHETLKGEEKVPCAGYMTLLSATQDFPIKKVSWEYADVDPDSEVFGPA